MIAHVQALMSLNGGLLLDWWRAIGTWERTVWPKNTMPALMASLVIGEVDHRCRGDVQERWTTDVGHI